MTYTRRLGYVRPLVVTDTILGEPGDKLKDDVISLCGIRE